MGMFDWDQSFSVGVEKFDNDHKKLFDIINKLADCILAGSEPTEIATLLDELINYTNYHFDEEIRQLSRLPDYDFLEQHKEMHRQYVQKLTDARDLMRKGDAVAAISSAFLASSSWLRNHIKTVDKKYEPLMHAAGIR